MARRSESLELPAVLECAQRRFLQWGYSGTSIAALAEDLGITKAALYYHYADKESLFLAVVSEFLSEVARDLGPLPRLFETAEPAEALGALAQVFLGRLETTTRIQHLAFQESRHLSLQGQEALGRSYHELMMRPVAALLQRAVEKGWVQRQPDEPEPIWVFLCLVSAFHPPGHRPGPSPSPETFVRLLCRTLKGES